MVEEKPRVQKVLECLYEADEPLKTKEIGERISESAMNVGKDLYDLSQKRGLAEKLGDGSWQITGEGRDYIESGGQPKAEPKPKPTEIAETIPSQADLFMSIGERLSVGARKGDVKLEAIMYYVQRTADLDNLTMVWNALTEMGVANDVKKRWIKLYAQTIPGKEIPEELREKLEAGQEAGLTAEELKARIGKGTAPEKYSVDTDTGAIKVASTTDKTALTWDEAEKLSKEVKKDIEARGGSEKEPAFILGEGGTWTLNPEAKIGFGEFAVFQMYQDSLRRGEPIDPVEELTKREEQSARLREAMGVKGGEDTGMTMLDKIDKLGLLRKPGEEGRASQLDVLDKLNELGLLKKPEEEGSSRISALETQVKDLMEELREKELDSLKTLVTGLSGQVSALRAEMAKESKLEGRYALMDKAIGTIDSQLSGIRGDIKPMLAGVGGGSGGPGAKSPEEKAIIAKGLKDAVALEKEARDLEDELLFGGRPEG